MNTTSTTTERQDNAYDFEKASRKSYRGGSVASTDSEKMIRRLGLANQMSGPLGELAPLIDDYVVQVNLNINWYQRALKKELRLRGVFFALSIAMLAAVPIVVLLLPQFVSSMLPPSDDTTNTYSIAQNVTAQITAVLTGLLGFQRAISAWLDKRKIAGSYAQTSAKLKDLVWSLHQKWNVREIVPAIKGELAEDLRDGIRDARQLTSDEQLFYFANLSYPTIDVGSILKSSGAQASSIAATHASPNMKALEARSKLQSAIMTAEAMMAEYSALIERKQEQYREAVASQDKHTIAAVHGELNHLYRKMNAAELDHAASVSRLADMTRA